METFRGLAMTLRCNNFTCKRQSSMTVCKRWSWIGSLHRAGFAFCSSFPLHFFYLHFKNVSLHRTSLVDMKRFSNPTWGGT